MEFPLGVSVSCHQWQPHSICIELDRRNGVFSRTMPARWVVTCPKCKTDFTHTFIGKMANESRDPFASPPKLKIPEGGSELACQNCGKTSTYRAFDLRYRAD